MSKQVSECEREREQRQKCQTDNCKKWWKERKKKEGIR